MIDTDDLAEWNSTAAAQAWLAHMPGCDCPGCSYVEHHIDDDDDTDERQDWEWRP